MPNTALKVDWTLIHQLAVQGAPLRDLAKQFGLRPSTVTSHAHRNGWAIQRVRADQQRTAALLNVPANSAPALPSVAECAIKLFPALASETKLGLAVAVRNAAQRLAEFKPNTIITKTRELKAVADAANLLFHWDDAKRNDNSAIKDDLFALSPLQLAKLATREAETLEVQDGNGQRLD